jgi:putative endonuclease
VATTYNDGVVFSEEGVEDMRAWFERLRILIVRPAAGPGQATGARSEAAAARFLARQGLSTLARNHRCRGGEIDLICRHGRTLVFVEVRMRGRSDYGGAAASITAAKRRRIVLAARHWLATCGGAEQRAACRFDVVLMAHAEDPAPHWITGAFDADARV